MFFYLLTLPTRPNLLGVSLEQIIDVTINVGEVNANFVDGGSLNVKGNSKVGFKVDGVTFVANRNNGSWYTK